jgi:uncharacterized peroxidase-related enzyme
MSRHHGGHSQRNVAMNRLVQLDPTQATGQAQQLFAGVQAQLGAVPNLFRVLGSAPAALKGYLDFHSALSTGTFGAKLREQVALAVAESNLCDYCLSAHSFLGGKVGLGDAAIAEARRATASDPKTDAVLKLARAIVVRRGELVDAELQQARAAGLSDGEIVETTAHVALNIFTNYVNHVARTVVDFPEVRPLLEAAATRG